ncbi:MAG: hypothetical protein ACREQ5_40740, partial [Candidatus Dormibacteria bacterium]
MTASARKRTSAPEPRQRSYLERESSVERSVADPADVPERARIGEMWIEAGPASSPATRLRVRELNELGKPGAREKEKVSLTLDRSLVDEIRAQFGGRALSKS